MSQQYPQQPPRQGGGGLFPFPHKTFETRGGSRVSVGGCCLPIPLGCLTVLAGAAVAGVAAVRSRS